MKKKKRKYIIKFPATFRAVSPEGEEMMLEAKSFDEIYLTVADKFYAERLPQEQGKQLLEAVIENIERNRK